MSLSKVLFPLLSTGSTQENRKSCRHDKIIVFDYALSRRLYYVYLDRGSKESHPLSLPPPQKKKKKSLDPDHTTPNEQSDLGLHCLPFGQNILNTSSYTCFIIS